MQTIEKLYNIDIVNIYFCFFEALILLFVYVLLYIVTEKNHLNIYCLCDSRSVIIHLKIVIGGYSHVQKN